MPPLSRTPLSRISRSSSSAQPDLPLGVPQGDAWLVQESDCTEYQHL